MLDTEKRLELASKVCPLRLAFLNEMIFSGKGKKDLLLKKILKQIDSLRHWLDEDWCDFERVTNDELKELGGGQTFIYYGWESNLRLNQFGGFEKVKDIFHEIEGSVSKNEQKIKHNIKIEIQKSCKKILSHIEALKN
jgi:hypothetical protein